MCFVTWESRRVLPGADALIPPFPMSNSRPAGRHNSRRATASGPREHDVSKVRLSRLMLLFGAVAVGNWLNQTPSRPNTRIIMQHLGNKN